MLFPTPNQQCQSTERKCSWLTYANDDDDDVVASWQPKCSDGKRVGTLDIEAEPTLWPPDLAATFGLETRLYRTRPRLVWSGLNSSMRLTVPDRSGLETVTSLPRCQLYSSHPTTSVFNCTTSAVFFGIV